MSVVGSVYTSMDSSEIAEDRRAIGEKLRRHQQMQKQHSRRVGGYDEETEVGPVPPDAGREYNTVNDVEMQDQYAEQYENEQYEYDEDVNDSIGVLQKALCKEPSVLSMHSAARNQQMREDRMRRHTSTKTPIVDCSPMNFPRAGQKIPRLESRENTIKSICYIILCIGLLVSYAFFLESCKLMNYGI